MSKVVILDDLEPGRFVVADIIYMDTIRPLAPEAKADIDLKRKILTVQKVFNCTRCPMKCEKCGNRVDMKAPGDSQDTRIRVPYTFCESCSEEYVDYIERLKGAGDAECYWRNESWLESWRRWIDYKSASDRFVRSSEFARLLKELKEKQP